MVKVLYLESDISEDFSFQGILHSTQMPSPEMATYLN